MAPTIPCLTRLNVTTLDSKKIKLKIPAGTQTGKLFRIKEAGKLKVIEGPEVRTVFFVMDEGSDELRDSNIKGRNPFKDKRVREAMNLALDREAIKRSIMRGLSVPAALMVPPGVNGYDAALDAPVKPDLDKARKLLGYETRVFMDEGLGKLVSWIKDKGPLPFGYHFDIEIRNELTPRTWTDRLI